MLRTVWTGSQRGSGSWRRHLFSNTQGQVLFVYKMIVVMRQLLFYVVWMVIVLVVVSHYAMKEFGRSNVNTLGLLYKRQCASSGIFSSVKAPDRIKSLESTSRYIQTLEGDHTLPGWIKDVCPGVYDHFTHVWYSGSHIKRGNETGWMPYFTTASAAHSVCSMEVSKYIAASIGTTIVLHAGSNLGAILHGGPIPWDDDADLLLPFGHLDRFFNTCNEIGKIHQDVTVKCYRDQNSCLKLVLVTNDSHVTHRSWEWPFVDIFSYLVRDGSLFELKRESGNPKVHKATMKFDLQKYYPLNTYYFGGIYILGPHRRVAAARYDFCVCKLPSWCHRVDALSKYKGSRTLDCDRLAQYLPFSDGVQLSNTRSNERIRVIPEEASNVSFAWSHWYREPEQRSTNIFKTDGNVTLLPYSDIVEVDNTIAPGDNTTRESLTVIDWNLAHGERWLESASILESYTPDVIILHDIDIGMARTGQQHIARMLAFRLEMNYAWGLESVELTDGNSNTGLGSDTLGLHGHAILSTYPIIDTKIIRDTKGMYTVDSKTGKRVGGRMMLLAKVGSLHDDHVVIGSMDDVLESSDTLHEKMKDFVDRDSSIVLAGRQDPSFCSNFGLYHANTSSLTNKNVWENSNIMCTSMHMKNSWAAAPVYLFGNKIEITVSTHALIGAHFTYG